MGDDRLQQLILVLVFGGGRQKARQTHSEHGVGRHHEGEDRGIHDPDVGHANNLEFGVHDSELIVNSAHLASTGLGGMQQVSDELQKKGRKAYRVINGVRDLATVLAQLLVGNDLRARSNLALEPLRKGSLSGNLASNLESIDEGLSVVVFGIGLQSEG